MLGHLKTSGDERNLNVNPDVQAEEVVQEAAPAPLSRLRAGILPASAADAAAPGDGAVAPEEVEAQVCNVGGSLGHAGSCSMCYFSWSAIPLTLGT